MKGMCVGIRYKEMFKTMREHEEIFANACLYKLTKNINTLKNLFSNLKMGRIDCPTIVQPEFLVALPNK